MEPTSFELEQTVFLPPHMQILLAASQPEYRPLEVVQLLGDEGRCISRWRFTPEERAAVAAGEDLYLEQLTFNPGLRDPARLFQPILPTIGLRDFCPADPEHPPS